MIKKNIVFRIFHGIMDTSLLKIAFRQVNAQDVSVLDSDSEIFEPGEDEISIICIKSLDEEIINKAFSYLNDNRKIVVITDSEDIILAATLSRIGFKDIFIFPYELQKFKNYLNEIIEQHLITIAKPEEDEGKSGFNSIIGSSSGIIEVKRLAEKVAGSPDVSVLILGETGTGKGLFAKAIHENSVKSKFPFVDINCTAIPGTLLESELFGFEKGAFTDARERKLGLMELAEEGTVFLDEIGDLNLEIQAKLLKALDKKAVRRLGGITDIPINARIIAATNGDLEKLVEQKKFRGDLFHRLNVIPIKIPPLRERGKDIFLIAEYFLKEITARFNKPHIKLDREIKDFMLNYPWPGNVRELKNAIERGVLLSDAESATLKIDNLFNMPRNRFSNKIPKSNYIHLELDFKENNLESVSKVYAQEVLLKFNSNKSKTADQLGISRPKLDKLLK